MDENEAGAGAEMFFTRATWRIGKHQVRKPRTKPYGGRTIAPPAFLAAAKVSGIGSGLHRLCRHCGRVAVRGTPVCYRHGGAAVAARKGYWVAKYSKAEREEKARLWREEQKARIDPELARLSLYQNVSEPEQIRLAKAWGKPEWVRVLRAVTRQF